MPPRRPSLSPRRSVSISLGPAEGAVRDRERNRSDCQAGSVSLSLSLSLSLSHTHTSTASSSSPSSPSLSARPSSARGCGRAASPCAGPGCLGLAGRVQERARAPEARAPEADTAYPPPCLRPVGPSIGYLYYFSLWCCALPNYPSSIYYLHLSLSLSRLSLSAYPCVFDLLYLSIFVSIQLSVHIIYLYDQSLSLSLSLFLFLFLFLSLSACGHRRPAWNRSRLCAQHGTALRRRRRRPDCGPLGTDPSPRGPE